jgi:hypothetical protein
LPAGRSCSISITFTPIAGGTANGLLAIDDNAAGDQQTVSVNGTGTNALTDSPNKLSFGTVTVGAGGVPQTVTVTNNQSVPAALTTSVSGADPGDFAITAVGTTRTSMLAAKTQCVYTVIFSPKDKKSRGGILTVNDSPDPTSPYSVALSGTGG